MKQLHKLAPKIKAIRKKLDKQKLTGIAVVLVLAIIGVHLLFPTHAASPYVSKEAESGTTTSPAQTQTDGTASGGQSVLFGNTAGSVLDALQLGGTLTEKTTLTETLPTSILSSSVSYVNISLDDHGTSDPEPSPGTYDWSSLDSRMAQLAPLLAADPKMAITMRVYQAPPWMEDSCTGSSTCKDPVDPAHYQDFANLVVAAAQRYPQIHYFAIWNELAGYQNTSPWNIQDYTNLYNTVYTALKSYNSNLQVGGPYAPFLVTKPSKEQYPLITQNPQTAMTYWLQNKIGADFIAIDGRTAGIPPAIPTDPVGYTAIFSQATQYIQQLQDSLKEARLPIWWMEWYARPADLTTPQPEWNAISTYSLMQMASSGANNALIWDAENTAGAGNESPTPGLWYSGTDDPTGLVPVFQVLQNDLYNTHVTLSAPTPGIEVLSNGRNYIAIDVDGVSHTTTILGSSVSFTPWQVVTQ